MGVSTKLLSGFGVIAVLTGIASYFSASLADHIRSLRYVELPMEHHLGQIDEIIWQLFDTVGSYVVTVDPAFLGRHREKTEELERYLAAYADLIDTDEERDTLEEFSRRWISIKASTKDVQALVARCQAAKEHLFETAEKADEVIDFEIQERFSPEDPDILAKEQAVREVEVSIWEAIHAAQRYASPGPNTARPGHAQRTFPDLMEKQFDDVKEFWDKYTSLARSPQERKAIAAFEALWAKAKTAGREVVALHGQMERQFAILAAQTQSLDDEVVDSRMRALVDQRVSARDAAGRRAKIIAIAVGLGAVLGAVGIGLLLTRSVSGPVARLKDATVELGKGNLAHRIHTSRTDEFGVVSNAFDRMAECVHAAAEKLQEQVAQRTAAQEFLKKANDELTTAMSKLSQVNEELRQFVYIASHDLREPLRKISSFGSLLQESLGSRLEADDRENLAFMIDGAKRMTQMIEGLLTYSRLNASDHVRERIDLNETVEKLQGLDLAAMLEETSAVLDVPQPLPAVVGHPGQISQLLQNLIANGIKYGREGVRPHITITAEEAGSAAVRICVQDNGIGIPPEHHENIFKMFRRLHSRRRYGGAGIGLAVCKRIVDRHGGEIGVAPGPGDGTTFWFTLRRAEAAQPQLAESAASARVSLDDPRQVEARCDDQT